MKNTRILLLVSCCLLFLTAKITAQNNPQDVTINPFWSFYSENYLSSASLGKGYTGIGAMGDISSTSLNPASLNLEKKFQIQVQYTYRTSHEWLTEVVDNVSLKQSLYSLSAAFGYRIDRHFQLGFLYSNPQSFSMDMGQLIETNESGIQIGSYDGTDKYIIHSFSLPIVYSNDYIRIGITANYSLYQHILPSPNSGDNVTGTMKRFNVQAGIIVTPSKQFSVGATFVPGYNGQVNYNTISWPSYASMPMKLGLGVEYTFKGRGTKIPADFEYTSTSVRDDLRDQHQFHAGLEYPFDKMWTFRAGVFNIEDPRNLSTGTWANANENLNQVCFTLGATCKLNKLDATLAIMDSHLSPGTFHNTFINGGLTYNFKTSK